MAEDQLSLTNAALGEAGSRSDITDLAEASKEARLAASVFSRTVRTVLASVPWDFATKTGVLRPMPGNPVIPPPHTFAFFRPTDALLIQGVYGAQMDTRPPIFPGAYGQSNINVNNAGFATSTIGGQRAILTTFAGAAARYSAWIVDFDQWAPMAIDFLIKSLAAKMCFQLTGDRVLATSLKEEARILESRARTVAANETLDVVDMPVDWLAIREAESALMPVVGGGILLHKKDGGVQFIDPYSVDLPSDLPDTGGTLWNNGGVISETPTLPQDNQISSEVSSLDGVFVTQEGSVLLPVVPPAKPGILWNDGGLLAVSQ